MIHPRPCRFADGQTDAAEMPPSGPFDSGSGLVSDDNGGR